MAGIDCIGQGYKDLLAALITRDTAKNILIEVLNGMPICEPMPQTLSNEGLKQLEATRKKSAEWNIAVDYTDANCNTTKYGSPSALAKFLNLKMSGQQTTCDGEKCKALDVVDIFRLQGYVVECQTEDTLKEGPDKITLDCVKAEAGGKAMHVYHPGAGIACEIKKLPKK